MAKKSVVKQYLNETVYIFNSSNGGDDIVANGKVMGQMHVTIIFSYGE